MPAWGDILGELQASAAERGPAGPDFDGIRSKYVERLHAHQGRAVIVYASAWLQRTGQQDPDLLVQGADVHALMEVCHGVPERELDLLLHSPGGSGPAAEQMLNYLRTQFDHIRAIVPLQAKSAATMIALGCDEIVMGKHSELGPIDPQIAIPVPGGYRFAPAYAILRDFERAKVEIAEDVRALPAWTPILHSYAGGLLDVCRQQIALSEDVVRGWLERYMLAHDDVGIPPDQRASVAQGLAGYFSSEESYERFREHGRPIRVEDLLGKPGLRIRRLEEDQELQDVVLSVYHAFDLTFVHRPAIKIVENHRGRRLVRISAELIFQPIPPPQPGGPAPNRQPNRPDRPPRSDRKKGRGR